jgi:hypothetical protein
MCDHAGMWDVDLERAEFDIGEKLSLEDISKYFGDRIKVIKDDKWFWQPFIPFQYKCEIEELNPESNVHLGVIKVLKRYDLYLNGNDKPLANPCQTLTEWMAKPSESPPKPTPTLSQPLANPSETLPKPTSTLMDMDKDNKSIIYNTSTKKKFVKPTIQEIEDYAEKIGYSLDAVKFWMFYEQKDWMVGKNKMKRWTAAVGNWKANGWGLREKVPVQISESDRLIRLYSDMSNSYPKYSQDEIIKAMALNKNDKEILQDELNKRAMPIPGG